jgi:hypothetical protein
MSPDLEPTKARLYSACCPWLAPWSPAKETS